MFENVMTKKEVEAIVLTGGSSRIPKISKFSASSKIDELNKSNPDEAVARGAALLAAILAGDKVEVLQDLQDLLSLDVVPQCIESVGNFMIPLIQRNATIPVRQLDSRMPSPPTLTTSLSFS